MGFCVVLHLPVFHGQVLRGVPKTSSRVRRVSESIMCTSLVACKRPSLNSGMTIPTRERFAFMVNWWLAAARGVSIPNGDRSTATCGKHYGSDHLVDADFTPILGYSVRDFNKLTVAKTTITATVPGPYQRWKVTPCASTYLPGCPTFPDWTPIITVH